MPLGVEDAFGWLGIKEGSVTECPSPIMLDSKLTIDRRR
jgi:hypothetical protein